MIPIHVYIIQTELGGISVKPDVFTKHASADQHYLWLVKIAYNQELKKNKKDLKSYAEAKEFVESKGDEAQWQIRYWISETKS